MKWRKRDIYDAVGHLWLFTILIQVNDGNTVWYGVECDSVRFGGGFADTIDNAKAAALDLLIGRLGEWKARAEAERDKLTKGV